MGGGPDKEHMVILLWETEPTTRIEAIKRRFPYIEITYLNLKDSNKPRDDGAKLDVPPELYEKVTTWVSLGVLPPNPQSVPNLKFIHLFSAGVDHFSNHPILTSSDIPITTSSGISAPPIAEWVLMTTLASTKHFTTTYEQQKSHTWGRNDAHLQSARDWVGKRIGIAGYGSIGRQVARLFTALGSDVIAYTAGPRSTPESRADHGYIVPGTGDSLGTLPKAWYSGTRKADLHGFLSQGLDLLVICLPLTKSTTHLFSSEEFRILADACPTPGGAYVANISRGKIIDQPALVEALNGGVLGGAMLDVAEPEPLPKDDPLWDAKNVVITPHISSLGVEYADRAYDVLTTNLARRERGEKMFNLVNRDKGY
jgi:phosphoglycerate dehydrogenase-like enzyme